MADLELVKKADKNSVGVNEPVTFTITLSNKGPNAATGVQVTDLISAGLTIQQVQATSGAFSASTGIWSISSINNGTQAVLTISAVVSKSGIVTNKAEVTAVDQKDPDSSPGNGVSTEDDQSSVSIQVVEVVSIEAQIKQLIAQVGSLVTQNKLNALHGRLLTELLNISLELFNRRHSPASILTLRAFIVSINQLIRTRQISRSEGQKLIEAAQKIIALIEKESDRMQSWNATTPPEEQSKSGISKLYQNFPNPFYVSTVISFDLAKQSRTQLYIYSANGKLVSTIIDQVMPAGKHYITWQAKTLASGKYFLTLKADNYTKTERMVIIK